MKKIFTLIALTLISGSVRADFWDNCTAYGGTIITANKYGADKGGLCNDPSNTDLSQNCNGKKFCASTKSMNWWSAFTWCEAIGGQQANFLSLCPGTQALNSQPAGVCPNIKGLQIPNDGWFTNMGWGKERVLLVFSNGSVNDQFARSTGRGNPICEEK